MGFRQSNCARPGWLLSVTALVIVTAGVPTADFLLHHPSQPVETIEACDPACEACGDAPCAMPAALTRALRPAVGSLLRTTLHRSEHDKIFIDHLKLRSPPDDPDADR